MGEKKSLDWSRRAERDAASIYDYIALDNQAAARQVMGELRKAINSLIEFPLLGRDGQISGTRELVLDHYPYTIVYRLTPTKIRILTVLHQSRQYP